MRLIDADALKKETNFSVTISGKDNAVEVKRLMELYNQAITNAPTIDAKPVVRCKDCDRGFGSPVCPIQGKGWAINKDTFFCAWGERREP